MKMRTLTIALLTFCALLAGKLPASAQPSAILTTICTFDGTNYSDPVGLIQGADGNFYGTSQGGGQFNYGTVFRLSSTGALTTLVSFDVTNGLIPYAPVMQAKDGNLYGESHAGGDAGGGTVYSVTTNGVVNYIISLADTNGFYSTAGIAEGRDGILYGVTEEGGYRNEGTFFSLTLGGLLTSYSFCQFPGSYLAYPQGALVEGADGIFFGADGRVGSVGNIYEITTNGEVTSLLAFNGANGANPFGPLVFGPDGNLYGVTGTGGTNGYGTVFRLSTNGVLATLFSFNGTNGSVLNLNAGYAIPQGLTLGSDGNFYGATVGGGNTGTGTLFQITPSGTLTTLYQFGNVAGDGVFPLGGMFQATDGNFYGVTLRGGMNNYGTIFRLNVPLAPLIHSVVQTNGTVAVVCNAVSGRTYQLQYSTDLSTSNWVNTASSITATNGSLSISDTVSSDPTRFYRVVLTQ